MERGTEDGLVEQVQPVQQVSVDGVNVRQQQSGGVVLLIKRDDVTIDWLSFFL